MFLPNDYLGRTVSLTADEAVGALPAQVLARCDGSQKNQQDADAADS